MAEEAPRFRSLLEHLTRHDVEFIVVGGVAAVLQGAPLATFDLDILHARTPENIARLLAALGELGATYRTRTNHDFEPTGEHLAGDGHHLLRTRLGPLDVLGAIEKGETYENLVDSALEQDLAGLRVRVLDLAALVRLKEGSVREKDVAMLPLLRRTLALRT